MTKVNAVVPVASEEYNEYDEYKLNQNKSVRQE